MYFRYLFLILSSVLFYRVWAASVDKQVEQAKRNVITSKPTLNHSANYTFHTPYYRNEEKINGFGYEIVDPISLSKFTPTHNQVYISDNEGDVPLNQESFQQMILSFLNNKGYQNTPYSNLANIRVDFFINEYAQSGGYWGNRYVFGGYLTVKWNEGSQVKSQKTHIIVYTRQGAFQQYRSRSAVMYQLKVTMANVISSLFTNLNAGSAIDNSTNSTLPTSPNPTIPSP